MKQPFKSWKMERLNVKHSGRCSCCGENRADSQQVFRPSTDKKSLRMWKAHRPSLQRTEATGKRRQLLFFLVLRPIHCTHNEPPVWMNATVLFTTQHPFREEGEKKKKKRTKRWKMPPVPRWPSRHQSARSPSSPGLFHSLPALLTQRWVWVLLHSSRVCLPLVWSTELDSTFPSDWLATSHCLCL